MTLLSNLRNTTFITCVRKFIPHRVVNYCEHFPVALLANLTYGFPSRYLTIVGVTGTDGKTTTSTMLYHILHHTGYKVALISTVSAKIGDEEIDTGFHVTSPEPFMLQKLLKEIVDRGFTHVVLEVTSHGLEQFRFWGVQFTGGIVTNITEDHLDYHGTWEKYALAKSRLFRNTHFAVLNAEDTSFDFLKTRVHGEIITYGKNSGNNTLHNYPITLKILGDYNLLNALAAGTAARELGVQKEIILKALASFEGVLGRMQVMQEKPFMIVVDFAHTPNALLTALTDLRKTTKGKLIAVFGCAGLRDTNRRKMGKVSAEHADITIITAEDPRTEGVEKISKEIAGWAVKGGAVEVTLSKLTKSNKLSYPVFVIVPNRGEAIEFGISLAQKGDVVGIFGKGHERSMCFGNTEMDWTDQAAVGKVLHSIL